MKSIVYIITVLLCFSVTCVNASNSSWGKKKKKKAGAEEDGGRMMVYVGNSAKKRKMVSILMDMLIGLRRKERGVRIFECSEAAVHLNRPLAVHVDGESCYCQQDLEVRCIPKRIRMIGS